MEYNQLLKKQVYIVFPRVVEVLYYSRVWLPWLPMGSVALCDSWLV